MLNFNGQALPLDIVMGFGGDVQVREVLPVVCIHHIISLNALL